MRVTVRNGLLIVFVAVCALAAGVSVLAQAGGKGSSEKKPSAAAPMTSGSSGDVVKGRGLYARTCAICHFSKSAETKIGPGLKSIYQRKFADGKKVDDASMRSWIETGGKNMPPFKNTLSQQEISDLIAYVRTL
jgi:mono/diheme cytochrome c family protein